MLPQLIFVYGTLKAGRGNHHYMNGCEYIGKLTTEPKYTLHTNGSFPIVTRGGQTAIKGELYKVTDQTALQRIYRLEHYTGTPGHVDNWYDVDQVAIGPNNHALMFVQNAEQVAGRGLKILETGVF